MTFRDILAKFRNISFSERDKGDRFERLMQAFLQTVPWYEGKFQHVWLWREFPYKENLGGKDTHRPRCPDGGRRFLGHSMQVL